MNFFARVINSLSFRGYLKWLPDALFLKLLWRLKMGYPLDLRNPRTFNEKLQWLKLHDRNPLYTQLVDKYEVRKFISKTIGEEYLIPLLGVWDRFDDIDFDKLPNQFVLKCTHDSGGLVICKDKSKFDIAAAKKKICRCLKLNYYWALREWPYKNVKPRIIAEKYMEDSADGELRDYKFFCFSGVAKILFIAANRGRSDVETTLDYFDMDFKHFEVMNGGHPNARTPVHKPETFEQMKKCAEILSAKIPQVRCDFYEVDGKVYFGEMTFYDGSGFDIYEPQSFDEMMGRWVKISDIRGGYDFCKFWVLPVGACPPRKLPYGLQILLLPRGTEGDVCFQGQGRKSDDGFLRHELSAFESADAGPEFKNLAA